MFVSPKYLERFAIPISAEPAAVALNGFEQAGNAAIAIDDGEGSYLSVVHRDANPEDAAAWELSDAPGMRQTFVVPQRDGAPIDGNGLLFEGLIALADLRTWYRERMGISDNEESGDGA